MTATPVAPYLFFDGRCEEALEFYKKAIGAEVGMLMRFKEAPEPLPSSMSAPGMEKKVMHAAFYVNGSMLMASDGYAKGQPKFQGFSLSLPAKDEADANKKFGALAEGGEVTMPLSKTFFAKSFGTVKDRFGVEWMVIVD